MSVVMAGKFVSMVICIPYKNLHDDSSSLEVKLVDFDYCSHQIHLNSSLSNLHLSCHYECSHEACAQLVRAGNAMCSLLRGLVNNEDWVWEFLRIGDPSKMWPISLGEIEEHGDPRLGGSHDYGEIDETLRGSPRRDGSPYGPKRVQHLSIFVFISGVSFCPCVNVLIDLVKLWLEFLKEKNIGDSIKDMERYNPKTRIVMKQMKRLEARLEERLNQIGKEHKEGLDLFKKGTQCVNANVEALSMDKEEQKRPPYCIKIREAIEIREIIVSIVVPLAIIDNQRSLGKTYNNHDHITKILRSLPRQWRPQVVALRASKDLKKLPMENFLAPSKFMPLNYIRIKAKERPLRLKKLQKDHCPKSSKLRNLMKKSLKKKDQMRMRYPLFRGKSTPFGKRKKGPNGRITLESSPKKLKTKVKWCATSAKSLDTSTSNVLAWTRRKRSPSLRRRRKVTWQHGRTLIYFPLKKRMKKQTFVIWLILLQSEKKMTKRFSKLSKKFDALQKENDILKEETEIGMRHQSWYLNSGYSCYMTEERFMLQDIRPNSRGWVTFRGNQKGKVTRIGRIGKHHFPSIDNILFVEGLKHNLLSISQLCDNGYDVFFNKGECIKGKQVRGSFESNNIVSTFRPLELLHIDFFGSTRITFMSEKCYGLVVVDDYTRWTWIMFLTHNDESFIVFSIFCKRFQNEKGINIASIKSDHGEEFENENFQSFMKNMPILKKTPYELWKVEESIHVKFNDSKLDKELSKLNDSFAYLNLENLQKSKENCLDEEPKEDKSKLASRNWKMKTYHLEQKILGNVQDRVITRSTFKDQAQISLLFELEPKRLDKGNARRTRLKLASLPKDKSIIGTVARLEAIHILLSSVAHDHMRLHQMDVKCAFLNSIINEEVYVKQPPRFKSDAFPNHQTPYPWYVMSHKTHIISGPKKSATKQLMSNQARNPPLGPSREHLNLADS
ncbi:hypothetical protein CR513_25976, partial [Mucuna pruriens]